MAFMSCSMQGPGVDGFVPASFDRANCEGLVDATETASCLSRPHLMVTGLGDGDEGGENRRLGFDLAPEGDRWLSYITEAAGQHSTFNYETSGCASYANNQGLDATVYPARCGQYLLWMRSVALAFLDHVLAQRPEATAYLASDNPSVLSGGALIWESK
jgi:hypothetical protein